MTYTVLMLVGLLIEIAAGWPQWLYARIQHPVVWIGSLISLMDRHLNNPHKTYRYRQIAGTMTTLCVVAVCTSIGWIISSALPDSIIGFIVEAIVVSSLLATRSLYEHVKAVADPLMQGNVTDARTALSYIVGRDTSLLDESGIAAAAIESLAENASDGVFAPLCWGLVFGLPGIAAYKAINTLDSMIGHRSDKYAAFGFCSAKLDDIANLLPARLSALLIAFAGGSLMRLSSVARDAAKHRSPNAGWPEGAMAYALRIKLSGPRTYSGIVTQEPWINEQSPPPSTLSLGSSLWIYQRTVLCTFVLLVSASLLI